MKVYTCPDCGKKFQEGFVPSECTGCGCPSSEFQLQEIKNEEGTNSNGDNKIIQFFLLIIVIGIVCGGGYAIYSASQQKAQKAEQERYELREKERVQRERNEQKKRQDDSSTKWKKFAGTTYKATQFLSNNVIQNYAFGYNSSGTGTYIIFETMPGTNVVTDQLEFSIYKVTSDADCIYLHCSEISSPVRIRIKGYSLYTNDGSERYEEWR